MSLVLMSLGSRLFFSPLARKCARRNAHFQFTRCCPRSLSALAILEHKDGNLLQGSLSVISAARTLGGPVDGLVAGGEIGSAVHKATKIPGLNNVISVRNELYDKGLPETYAPLIVENVKKGQYTHVIAAHSTFGKNIMPRVAALLDMQQVSDIIRILDDSTFMRPIYAGNAIATVESSDRIKILTVRGPAFPPGELDGGSAQIQEGLDPRIAPSMEWLSEDLTKSDRPDLTTAPRVVSGGRGLKSRDNFDAIMLPLADSLGAAVGASRAAVDDGYADNSLQVGQTGKVVAPQLYIAVGISGAIQHLAGMKDSKVIAAINKNPDEPIFQVADVGLVGDLFEKVPELTDKIKRL